MHHATHRLFQSFDLVDQVTLFEKLSELHWLITGLTGSFHSTQVDHALLGTGIFDLFLNVLLTAVRPLLGIKGSGIESNSDHILKSDLYCQELHVIFKCATIQTCEYRNTLIIINIKYEFKSIAFWPPIQSIMMMML